MLSYKQKGLLFYALLLLPGLTVFVVIVSYPLILTVLYSFTNLHLFLPSGAFVGLRNYLYVLAPGSLFFVALKNGIIWTASSVSAQLIIGLLAAMALQKIKFGGTFLKVVLIIPWTFPSASLAFIWRWMLDPVRGLVNFALIRLGFLSQPVSWFGSVERAMFSVIIMHIWFGFPFMMVALLAGLQAIPKDYYDAAVVDGASGWERFIYITVPLLKKIIYIIVVLRSIWTFNNFDAIYLTTGGGPSQHTLTVPVLAYTVGWRQALLGRAAAVITLSMGVMFILAIFALREKKETL